MKIQKRLLLVILTLMLSLFIVNPVSGYDTLVPLQRNGIDVTHFWSSEKVMIPDTYEEKDTEFRGVWVATVYNLNMPVHTSETQYKAAFQNLISELLESNMNAMLFQVRPTNDAFYDSDYAPWSRYLTGTEGLDTGWDVLAWMIEECHANGIEFHAWMNPYRVANTTSTQETYINTLAPDNFAKLRPDLVVSGNKDSNDRNPLILNPGEPEVKTYIRNVVTEIIENYDVDGVHFDDYFYPYSGISTDTATYDTYKLPDQAIDDWRRENVNDVVRGIKEDIDAYNQFSGKSVKFGISPFGLWGSGIEGYTQYLEGGSNTGPTNLSSYRTQYADSKKWVEEGWLHYICPQVYFSFTHSTAPYADVVDWWASIARGTGVDVYIGHAPSSAYSQSWVTEEISDQLRYNQQHPEIKGEVMYSAAYLDYSHMQYVEQNNWTVTPLNVYDLSDADITVELTGDKVGNIFIDDVTVTLTAADTIWYQVDDGLWTEYVNPFYVTGTGAHVLYFKTVDEFGTESSVSSYNVAIQYLNADKPTISISGTQIGDNYVVGSVVTITSDSEDIYVKINHGSVGTYVPYTGPITLDDDGGYYITAKTIDERDTESEEAILSITLQEECYGTPTIQIAGAGADPYYQSATITLTGETDLQYKINDGIWQNYTAPFVLDQEGSYTIYYRNDDACTLAYTKTITIDHTPPADPTMTIVGTYDGVKYYTTETTVYLTSAEANTTIHYRLHNGSTWSQWMIYEEPVELLYTANYTFEFYVSDQALNQSELMSERVRLLIPPSETNPYVIRDNMAVTYYNSSELILLPTDYTEKEEEIRAIWVATVSNIDIGLHTSEEQYKALIINMLDEIEANNFNLVFFQVRPMNDAFYDSDYAPWSRFLTGTEGQDPGWDVLAFMIDECHKRGIELHAWLNPYRVSTGTTSKESQLALLDEDNFARQHPDLVIADNSGKLILNPGERQVQVYIRNVIQELISNYDVDGIHFDDYFYSYNGTPLSADSALYERLKDPGETLDDWRRENINTVVREISEMIADYNLNHGTTVRFGISPFGIWKSGGEDGSNTSPYTMQSYYDQYADTKHWVEEGWLDYIMPQLYWQFDHSSAPFADLVDWWAALCDANDVDLIIGHGLYRYVDDSWSDTNELPEQLRYISQYDIIIGSAFFSYRSLLSIDKELVEFLDRLNNYYWTEYATFPWESDIVKQEDPSCELGEEWNGEECVSVCQLGEEWNGEECVSVCQLGEEWNGEECVSVCELGEEWNGEECVSVCQLGEEWNGEECVSVCELGEEWNGEECVSVCELGEEWNGEECVSVCQLGEEWDGEQCVSVCELGEQWNGEECESICEIYQTYQEGQCVDNPCADGYERVDGVCQLIEVPETGCFLFNLATLLAMGIMTLGSFYLSRKWFF